MPTAAERTGDFSDLSGTQIRRTHSTTTAVSRKPDSASRLSPVSQYLLKTFLCPTARRQQINYLGPGQRWADDQFMVEGDYIRGKHQLSVRYFFTQFQPAAGLPHKADLLQADGNGNQVRVQNIAVTDTYNATPHLLLNTWFGWNQQNGGSISGAPFCPPAAGVEIAGATPASWRLVWRRLLAASAAITTAHFNGATRRIREDVTYIKGTHELHFGGEALRIRAPMANEFEQNG